MAKFQKGQSGNPGGRPKGYGEFYERCRDFTFEAIDYMVTVLGNSNENTGLRLKAAEDLIAHGWGRPPQAVLVAQGNSDDTPMGRFLRSIDGESRRLPPHALPGAKTSGS